MYGFLGSFVCLCVIKFSLCSESVVDHPSYQYLPENCGVSVFSDTRIIGGREASLGQYPWIARLGYKLQGRDELSFLCAGSIINKWHVITAKHCLKEELLVAISQVRVGENQPSKGYDCEGSVCAPPPQDIDIQFVRLLKSSVSEDKSYGDIGVIKLTRPIIFNDFVQPVCLPTPDMVEHIDDILKIGSIVEVAGWGTVHPNRTKLPKKLMYVKLPIVEREECKNTFQRNFIDESQVCIGVGAGQDTCVGDSGGPVMKPIALRGPPRYFLLGLVSYGTKTCGIRPAVYTNIVYYMDWILNHIEKVM